MYGRVVCRGGGRVGMEGCIQWGLGFEVEAGTTEQLV